MARSVTVTPCAARAFQAAWRWLFQPGSGHVARARREDRLAARRLLREAPYLGELSEEHPGYRKLSAAGYRIIHPDTGDAATAGDVRVVALFGPGQANEPLPPGA